MGVHSVSCDVFCVLMPAWMDACVYIVVLAVVKAPREYERTNSMKINAEMLTAQAKRVNLGERNMP